MKKSLLLLVTLCFVIGMSGTGWAQDQVGFNVLDWGQPLAGENFLVMFHWRNAQNNNFWEWTWFEPDEEGGGDYIWNVPDPMDGWFVDGWKAACPTTLPMPIDPASYTVTWWFELDPEWFEWTIRAPIR